MIIEILILITVSLISGAVGFWLGQRMKVRRSARVAAALMRWAPIAEAELGLNDEIPAECLEALCQARDSIERGEPLMLRSGS